MNTREENTILADGRWSGPHGIGRFSAEVLPRLQRTDIFQNGPKPLSLQNLFWQPAQLHKYKNSHKVFFTPGFNPVLYSSLAFVFTIHDLIHLHVPGNAKLAKRVFYETLMKPAVRQARKILTVSEYSKQTILDWSDIPESQVVVVSSGISAHLQREGERHEPGYPYLLHVGNTKEHKNPVRLVEAFAHAKIDKGIRLVFTGIRSPELNAVIEKNHLQQRVVFSGTINDNDLANYYRGALAVTFPSLHEGFGLPPLEAMACGTPALTSNITSMPEVCGEAAVLVDPYRIDSITEGIERVVNHNVLREVLIARGLERVKLFSWDKTAAAVQSVLDDI